MTRELGPASRALLDAARDGLGPDPAAIARMRGRIDAAVAVPAIGLGIAAKLGLAGVVAAIAIGAGLFATRSTGEQSLPIAAFDAHEAAAPIVVPHVVTVAPEQPMIEMAPVHRDTDARTVVVTKAAPNAVVSAGGGVDLAREVELVDRAMTALRGGDLSSALVAVRLHAVETANRGQLAEDAAAIEIEALCKLHDPSASNRLVAFDRRWPSSAQRSRLTTSCK